MTSHPRTNQLRSSHVDTDGAEPKNSQNPTPRIVVLTGAGISAESGISTFRDANGMWERHRIEDVASPRAFAADPDMVHRFYDARRARLSEVHPNAAHWALSRLEAVFPGDVLIITQNVDDLHERAMSRNVIHMHGRLLSALCTACGSQGEQYEELGSRPACRNCGERALRPDIVWFGEQVYEGERINRAVANCEVFAVIGTSGVVHPAAGLVEIAADHGAQTVLIDLDIDAHEDLYDFAYEGPASECVPHWVREMMLRHGEGVLRGHEGQDLSGELVQNIANFVQAERYGRAVDLGERHTPEGLPELLKELGLRAEEHEFHEARYQLEPLMAGLLYDDGNSGEGGSYAFGVHLSSYGASTGPILTDLHQAQIEHAADLIAWTIADIGMVPDASPKENDQNFNINKLTSSFTGEV